MRIGLIGFQLELPETLPEKLDMTLKVFGGVKYWRIGRRQFDLDAIDLSGVSEELKKATQALGKSDDLLTSISATNIGSSLGTFCQFEVYTVRSSSAVRIRLGRSSSLRDDVKICCRHLSRLVAIWDPDKAYVTDFERLENKCPELVRKFPSGYAVYRKGTKCIDDELFESLVMGNGICVRFRDEFLNSRDPSCKELDSLIELMGGVDDRFSVLV